MTTVTVEFSGNTDLEQVLIDETQVLAGVGSASRQVPDGKDHALMWFVRGEPGSNFEVKITQPDSIKFSHKGIIDSSTKDAGLHWFRTGGAK